jgi:hypothetical protein
MKYIHRKENEDAEARREIPRFIAVNVFGCYPIHLYNPPKSWFRQYSSLKHQYLRVETKQKEIVLVEPQVS